MNLAARIDFEHGPPMDIISSVLRGFIIPAEGHDLLVADFSAIEARGLAWLAGEEKVLTAFRNNEDLYCLAAQDIYGHPVTKKQHPDKRQVGKVVVLACIAEGQMVLTHEGLVPIECVENHHMLWDGLQWVKHGGVVYRGVRHAQEYQGLTATPDHIVFTDDGREVAFGDVARLGLTIAQTGIGGRPVRLGRDHFARDPEARRRGQARARGHVPLRSDALRGLRASSLAVLRQLASGAIPGVPAMQPAGHRAEVASEADQRDAIPLRKSEVSLVQALWWARRPLQLSIGERRGRMDREELGARARQGTRSDRQQWALRAWELAMGLSQRAVPQHTAHEGPRIAELAQPILPDHDGEALEGWDDGGRDPCDGSARHQGEAQVVAQDRGAVRVYDILNAGPRNRFTVSGVLVHNCGYQGSVGAFQAMAKGYGVKVENKEALKIVKAWRAANENIVAYWSDCERAAITALQRPGERFTAGPMGRHVTYMKRGSFLCCRLPSGRTLFYPYPKLVPYVWMEKVTVGEDGEEQRESKRVPVGEKNRWWAKGWETNGAESPALHYRYMDTVQGWTEGPTYGGSLVENITQAVCRDVLAEAIVRLEAKGYPVVFHVHDEAVCEVPEGFGSADEMCAIMSEVPAWATDFPIAAAGFRTKRYRKDD